jgi:hypothetical protein
MPADKELVICDRQGVHNRVRASGDIRRIEPENRRAGADVERRQVLDGDHLRAGGTRWPVGQLCELATDPEHVSVPGEGADGTVDRPGSGGRVLEGRR